MPILIICMMDEMLSRDVISQTRQAYISVELSRYMVVRSHRFLAKISSPFCSPETVPFFEVKKRCTDIELSGILFSFCLCYSWC